MAPNSIRTTNSVHCLTYRCEPSGQPTYWAKLFGVENGEEVDFLESANINLIEDGITIAGWESHTGNVQLCWCVPLTPVENAELKAMLDWLKT